MRTVTICLTANELATIFQHCSPTAAYLYLYIRNGNDPCNASEINMTPEQINSALAELRCAGIYRPTMPEKPNYTERDIVESAEKSAAFRQLIQQAEGRLGRVLRTEDLKMLLNITNYLGLSPEVTLLLIDHCIAITNGRMPSMYFIEKEAYRWSDADIGTIEDAQFYIQQKNQKHTAIASICRIVQIYGRQLTAPEEAYVQQWLQKGYSEEMIRQAYEKACMATGGRNWAYMDRVLSAKHSRKNSPQRSTSDACIAENAEAARRLLEMDIDDFLGIPKNQTNNQTIY